jgi:lipopolysaccharide transport system permease protein
LLGIAFFGQGLTFGILWLPVVLLPLVMLCLGIAWFISALGVFIRDISPLTQFGATALMFGSAVFYSASSIPPAAWTFLRFNPMLIAIEIARDGVLWHRSPHLTHVAYLWIFSMITCYTGYAVFRKLKPAFADVL